MTNKLILCLLAALTGIYNPSSAQSDTSAVAAGASADSATIYVYRVGQFMGAGANWAMFLNGQKVCKLSNNKYMVLRVAKGKHTISAKIGGVEIFKKETVIELETEGGGAYYVACNIKQSITRSRLELTEVTKSTANKQMEKMEPDNCQAGIESKE